MHPDLIIVLEDGQVRSVVSNHHLTYAVISGPSSTSLLDVDPNSQNCCHVKDKVLFHPRECEFVGTRREMLRHVGIPIEPTKEFDPTAVVNLTSENKFLSTALGKYGITIDPAVKALASKPELLNEAIVRGLRALYNAFIVTDPKLMEQYLSVQTR